ncbi:MAG: hypothetical protein KF684_03170 [Phycisphaeraceae bacterium]|nr:hypothetical protein [Phycisphaeraceae bacterium]
MHTTRLARLKIRAWLSLLGVPIATAGVLSLLPGWFTLPMIGVAAWALIALLGGSTKAMAEPVCWTCSTDLRDHPTTAYGVVCPHCGTVNCFDAGNEVFEPGECALPVFEEESAEPSSVSTEESASR